MVEFDSDIVVISLYDLKNNTRNALKDMLKVLLPTDYEKAYTEAINVFNTPLTTDKITQKGTYDNKQVSINKFSETEASFIIRGSVK